MYFVSLLYKINIINLYIAQCEKTAGKEKEAGLAAASFEILISLIYCGCLTVFF